LHLLVVSRSAFAFRLPALVIVCYINLLPDAMPGAHRDRDRDRDRDRNFGCGRRPRYAKLISDLSRYKDSVDIHVLVGSASSGHSTHLLFSHFVEQILPRNAYDSQLLRGIKPDQPAEPAPPPIAPLRAKVKA